MNSRNSLPAVALLAGVAGAAAQLPIINGTADPSYGAPVVVQNAQTGFGDSNLGVPDFANGSELDGAFASIHGGVLYLVLTGNLESNFNKLEIFFDTRAGGQNRLRGDNSSVDFNGLNRMGDDGSSNGLTFDQGFEPDYWVGVTGGGAPYGFFANFAELLTNGGGTGYFLGQTVAASDGTLLGGNNPWNIRATINNSNTAGVAAGFGSGSGAGVSTGIELAIPLSALGNPTGLIAICAFVNGSSHDFVSNQSLAPLGPSGNPGEPRQVNLGAVPGGQYFVVAQSGSGPPEDECNGPVRIDGAGLFPFDTREATASSGTSCAPALPDIWLSWLPECDGFYTIETCGYSQANTALAAYNGGACPLGAPLACNDDACSQQSQIQFGAVGGQLYMLRVGAAGFGDEGGLGFLAIQRIEGECPHHGCACDWNVDGILNSQDFFDYLASFFAGNGDFNQDGVTNSQDFFDFLTCFFGGCGEHPGACCLGSGVCQIMNGEDCLAAGGIFGGANSHCEIPAGYTTSVPTLVRMYQTVTPAVTPAYAATLASQFFGFSGTVSEDALSVQVESGPLVLVVYKASAAFEYQDRSKLWNAAYQLLPSTPAQAISLATSFLEANGLMSPGASLQLIRAEFMRDASGAAITNHWLVRFSQTVDARAGLGAPMPVPVVGATIDVRIGNGEVIGAFHHARPIQPAGIAATYSIEQAQQLAGQPAGCPFGISFFYHLYGVTSDQQFLAPEYDLRPATGHGHGDGMAVPASDILPRARIVSPAAGAQFGPCAPISLECAVLAGTPPFTFQWLDPVESDHQGLSDAPSHPGLDLGTANPQVVTWLSQGTHEVVVIVTDANGFVAQAQTPFVATEGNCYSRASSCPGVTNGPRFRRVNSCNGWSLDAEITADDGLRVSNVQFLGNMVAFDMQLPYYWLQTEKMGLQPAELKDPPGKNEFGNCRSVLLDPGLEVVCDKAHLMVRACYWIDQIPDAPPSNMGQMKMCQNFLFFPREVGCAPAILSERDAVPCARFRPAANYYYVPPPSGVNDFLNIHIYQRFDFDVPLLDRCAFVKDADTFAGLVRQVGDQPGPPNEVSYSVAVRGTPGERDNYHQRRGGNPVSLPGCSGGGWDCIHVHWRWSAFFGPPFGNGAVFPPPSQTVNATALRWHAGEIDPPGFLLGAFRIPPEPIGNVDRDVVLWQETHSDISADLTSQNQWFFR